MSINIITTLHPDNDDNVNLYPNIKKENIPNKAINIDRLDNDVINLFNGFSQPKYYDTLPTTNVGLVVYSDGYLYSWNGSQYVSTGIVYQSTQLADESVTYSKLNNNVTDILDTFELNIFNSNKYLTRSIWDLTGNSIYWAIGGVAVDIGNTDNPKRCRTPHCLYLHPNDFIIFESFNDDIFFQVREYQNGLINVSGYPSTYNEGNIKKKIYKPHYNCLRIVIVADNTNYTTISDILSQVSIKIIHSNYDLERNIYKGVSQNISDFYLEDGGLTNSSNKNIWGINNNPSTEYGNSTKRINYKIAVNPNETIRIISTKENIFVKIWGYNQVSLSSNAVADTWTTLTQDAQITGYPYIRFCIFSRNPITREYIEITDLNDVKENVYFIHIANDGNNYNYPKKIRVASYNIGHYSGGSSSSSTSSEEDLPNYYLAFSKLKTDVLLIEEDNAHWFDEDNTIDLRNDLYNNFFKYYYGGTQYDYNCNSICSNYPLQKAEESKFTNYSQTRYYMDSVVNIDGKNVHFIITHLDFSSSELRQSQINELIDLVSDYEYFVIGGDFNTAQDGQSTGEVDFGLFKNAGYNVANYGMFGIFPTFISSVSQQGIGMDNIITSPNIKIVNVETPELDTSDHLPILADILIY